MAATYAAARDASSSISVHDLHYIINHVFLPPKLPQKDDTNVRQEYILLEECEIALNSFQRYASPNEWRKLATCSRMIRKMREMRNLSGELTMDGVGDSLQSMTDGDVLALFTRAQNAGLIVRKLCQHYSFESFELSPTTQSVMKAYCLQRLFPGPAIAVDKKKIEDPHFRGALVQLLTQLDVNTPAESWPIVEKGGSKTIEIRDSIHPKFVTEFLTGVLRGIGKPLDVTRILKRTRDDVLWNNAKLPWRRSPLWLLLRVALQTTLIEQDQKNAHRCYKSFMIFFMAHIVERALDADLPSDLLYVMTAKISRRTLKLTVEDDLSWMQYVSQNVAATHKRLSSRWENLEMELDPFGTQKAWELSELSLSDTSLSLHTLQPYLQSIKLRETSRPNSCDFKPNCPQRIRQVFSCFPEKALVKSGCGLATRLALADLEAWVKNHLDSWLNINIGHETSCSAIADLILHYTSIATSLYSGSPEDMSLMFLTIMDLWVALDKCVVCHHPLLGDYDPGFPQTLFDPLLLPKREQMKRLVSVETYLAERRKKSNSGSQYIFEFNNLDQSFGVRYFEQSNKHQLLRCQIETVARIERENKKAEYRTKQDKYNRLMRESDLLYCEYQNPGRRARKARHAPWCKKCGLRSSANDIDIKVHEWPLPKSELEVKSAVFELDVPEAISKWRDITYGLLEDNFSPEDDSSPLCNPIKELYRMEEVEGLSSYVRSRCARVRPASVAKPFTRTHYRQKPIAQATVENICVNNGLHYSLFDENLRKWSQNPTRCDIRKKCTFQLPKGPFERLQFALDGTTHTSNEVLAKQSTCPKSLNLHEFYAFATLRSGDLLQWHNIARELAHRILNFNREEAYMLVTQAAWQAGRSKVDVIYRESHIDLKEHEFGMSLLSVLKEALETVKENWQGAAALRTFVILVARLLSLSTSHEVQKECLLLLESARFCALEWTRDVRGLREVAKSEESDTLGLRVLEMALTCHATFDVDEDYLPRILESDRDVSVIIECSIMVHDHCPTVTDGLPRQTLSLLQRYWRLSHRLEPHVRERILKSRQCIDGTIRDRIWSGYQSGTSWSALDCPNERWLITKTSSEHGYQSMVVHYDILDGLLLINGAPLTRLHEAYETHNTYRRIFKQKILDIIPSPMEGMLYQSSSDIHGYQVHFAMYGSELIIRTRKDDRTHELIPMHALDGDFPSPFVTDYTHWLDIDTDSIEWRPLASAWEPSPDNWQMVIESGKHVIRKATMELVDIRSRTAGAISQVLCPLEQANYICTIVDKDAKQLNINLPRLKLDFFLKDLEKRLLESKQFRNMVIDNKQSFGTFTGLVNKLVLREIEGLARTVVVPYGKASFVSERHHVRVSIDASSATNISYHSYRIDNQLGRLVDNGSLKSRLFRLYLHALTSHCLVDQLTGRTGTEEALHGLDSAATSSFIDLDPIDIELLSSISKLTPIRQYYPKHLEVMQQIDWLHLSPLSQHPAFHKKVERIFAHAKALLVFEQRFEPLPDLESRGVSFLHHRAAARDSSFRVHEFGAEDFNTKHDMVYASRDRITKPSREQKACYTAKLVDEWSTHLSPSQHLLREIESWRADIQGPIDLTDGELTIGFDLLWLQEPAKILPSSWIALPFQIREGYKPVRDTLTKLVRQHAKPLQACPEYNLVALLDEDPEETDDRREEEYQKAKESHVKLFVEALEMQWPIATLSRPPGTSYSTYINTDSAIRSSNTYFQMWYHNAEFKTFIDKVQIILNDITRFKGELERYSFSSPESIYTLRDRYLTFTHLVSTPAPDLPSGEPESFNKWTVNVTGAYRDRSQLRNLLTDLSSHTSTDHESLYVNDLQKSFEALHQDAVKENLPKGFIKLLELNLSRAEKHVKCLFDLLCSNLLHNTGTISRISQLIPRLSPTTLLSYLAKGKAKGLPKDWRDAFVKYGLSLTGLQRAERLLAASTNITDLLAELQNPGHEDWDPMHHPEWLLLEVENNILIRREQAQIAEEMMNPSSGQNSVMQLNMGQGKSSVIVPIVAAALADSTRLVRVIVLKPLLIQMFHSLVMKLGGMVNRRIFYMPISRSLKLNVEKAQQICNLYKECMKIGGVILLQPEHILSFELLGLERLHSEETGLGNVMTQTQDWLRRNSRDILDESDEILSTRFELIYTIGTQRGIEFGPDRWIIIQHVLYCLSKIAQQFCEHYPHDIQVEDRQPGSFPRIRILQENRGKELLKRVAMVLCNDGLPGVPVCFFPQENRETLLRFLTERNVDESAISSLKVATEESQLIWKALLLLRGLFGCGILAFAFEQKRWRVNYGLDLSRTMLAVPYHAKDCPSARSEFSHPDVTLVLTCLSYYYGGLSDEQIRSSFEELLQLDHATEEYDKWVRDAPDLPLEFKSLTSVNLSNFDQCRQKVFQHLRLARSAINFYLSSIVFPAEMKEFPHKLSSSGWDIAAEKSYPTTGFSGTNDSRYILPSSINQCDLAPQLSTNAAVLDCLLRPENSYMDISSDSPTRILDAEALLNIALKLTPPVRVILDVGAQVLELQNEEVVRKWLSMVSESEAQAAIYFDSRNELCVLGRDGTKELLQVSPFAKQMDQCLVYLDESHTRGTDLKMPSNYRALVTLGPRLTKDRLVQACMRMRKLGRGQSVIFCAAMEVQRKIREHSSNSRKQIEVSDVLKWCIAETIANTRRNVPLWATQGVRHQHRQAVYTRSRATCQGLSRELVESLLEPEAQTLEQRYGARYKTHEEQILSESIIDESLSKRKVHLDAIQAKCREFKVVSFNTAALHEEQERELSPENEREQQVELPPPAVPLIHSVHEDLRQLIAHGILKRNSDAFLPAFEVFRDTTAHDYYKTLNWPTDLFVTKDFARSIRSSGQPLDHFLRPVHWVLSCREGSTVQLVVISPYEAQELLPSIRLSKICSLHTYSARSSVTVRTLEDLAFCPFSAQSQALPNSNTIIQLNLFAGQLYLKDFEAYELLCDFLGLCSRTPDDGISVGIDGFIRPREKNNPDNSQPRSSAFITSPVDFIRSILTMRRKGLSFASSHFGKILTGQLIKSDDFE
ncbi:hypothetical protein F5884DRAFT_687263 [Xylogone sp. PMI_703]|nr:hypothetical protein F5884DRAFT_687263 [Xylogone sp. PMI_703]